MREKKPYKFLLYFVDVYLVYWVNLNIGKNNIYVYSGKTNRAIIIII